MEIFPSWHAKILRIWFFLTNFFTFFFLFPLPPTLKNFNFWFSGGAKAPHALAVLYSYQSVGLSFRLATLFRRPLSLFCRKRNNCSVLSPGHRKLWAKPRVDCWKNDFWSFKWPILLWYIPHPSRMLCSILVFLLLLHIFWYVGRSRKHMTILLNDYKAINRANISLSYKIYGHLNQKIHNKLNFMQKSLKKNISKIEFQPAYFCWMFLKNCSKKHKKIITQEIAIYVVKLFPGKQKTFIGYLNYYLIAFGVVFWNLGLFVSPYTHRRTHITNCRIF